MGVLQLMPSIPEELDYSPSSFLQGGAVLRPEDVEPLSCMYEYVLCGSEISSDTIIEHFNVTMNNLSNISITSYSNNGADTQYINVNTLYANLENTFVLEDFNVSEHNISHDTPIDSGDFFSRFGYLTKTLFSFCFFNEAYEMFATLNSLLKAYDPLPNFPFPVVAAQKGMRPIPTPPPRPPSSGTSGRQFTSANQFPSFTANNNVPRASNDNFPGFSSNHGCHPPTPNARTNHYNNPSTIPSSYTPIPTPTTYHYGTSGYSTNPNSLSSSYTSPSPVSTASQSSSFSYNTPSIVDIPSVRIEPEPFKPIPSISPVNINVPPINTPSISSISSTPIEHFKSIDIHHPTVSHDFSIGGERLAIEKMEKSIYVAFDTKKDSLENPWPGYNDYAKREVAQKASYLRYLIRETTKIAVFYNIPMDYNYLRQVLSVNIDVAISTLESGFVLEAMFYQSPLYTKGYSQTEENSNTFDKRDGSSNGGDGGNRTNTGNSADIDIVNQAIASKDIEKIAAALKQAFSWNINIEVLNKIPKELYNYPINLADSSPKFPGIKFSNTKNHHIRIMRGRPDGHPSQQQDYVKIVSNSKVGLRDGSFVSSGDIKKASHHSEAHIPLNEWMNWRTWNEK